MRMTAGTGAGAAAGHPARAAIRASRPEPHDAPIRDWSEAGFDDTLYSTAPSPRGGVQAALHAVGALGSLALVVGIGIWGYGQVMRDVSGVPVVQALDGPMRVTPDRPGGRISDHSGLAVNALKAGGAAAPPPERLKLAPDEVTLAEEDRPAPELAPAPEPRPAPEPARKPAAPPPEADAALPIVEASLDVSGMSEAEAARSFAIVAAIADGLALPDETQQAQARATARGEADGTALEVAAVGGVGLAQSLRPAPRPSARSTRAAARTADGAAVTLASAPSTTDDLAPVEAGTRLVQLGAFDTMQDARAAWGEIAGRFAPMLEDKARVLQQAEAGGRTFWRLRAQGFDDIADARRFCAALVADQADCIPVVAR